MAFTLECNPQNTKIDQLYVYIKWGRTPIIELVQDLRTINVFATFENDLKKITDANLQSHSDDGNNFTASSSKWVNSMAPRKF